MPSSSMWTTIVRVRFGDESDFMPTESNLPFALRSASESDIDPILSLLCEVASQVPISLSTPQHITAMRRQIHDRYLTGFSLVAIHESGTVVGFQLAQRMSWVGDTYIHLAYAAVTPCATGNKVFRRLIEAEKQHGLPLVAEVKANNKSEMAARLVCCNRP